MANLCGSLNKRKERKSDWEQRLKSTSSINSLPPHSRAPLYPGSLSPTFQKILWISRPWVKVPFSEASFRSSANSQSSPNSSIFPRKIPSAPCFNFPFPMRFSEGTPA